MVELKTCYASFLLRSYVDTYYLQKISTVIFVGQNDEVLNSLRATVGRLDYKHCLKIKFMSCHSYSDCPVLT